MGAVMIGVRKLWAAGGLILTVGLLWLACNGGSSDGPGGSQVGLAGSCQRLTELERFRYTVAYTLDSAKPDVLLDETALGDPPFALPPNFDAFLLKQVFDGSFEGPDRFLFEIETPSEENQGVLRLLFVGDKAWADNGTGFVESDLPNVFTPSRVCELTLGGLDLSGLPSSPETVNEVEARRLDVDGVQRDTATVLFGQQSDMGRLLTTYDIEVWLAEDGDWPVRMTAKSTGTYPSGRELTMEISLDIADVNSDDISIEPPSE